MFKEFLKKLSKRLGREKRFLSTISLSIAGFVEPTTTLAQDLLILYHKTGCFIGWVIMLVLLLLIVIVFLWSKHTDWLILFFFKVGAFISKFVKGDFIYWYLGIFVFFLFDANTYIGRKYRYIGYQLAKYRDKVNERVFWSYSGFTRMEQAWGLGTSPVVGYLSLASVGVVMSANNNMADNNGFDAEGSQWRWNMNVNVTVEQMYIGFCTAIEHNWIWAEKNIQGYHVRLWDGLLKDHSNVVELFEEEERKNPEFDGWKNYFEYVKLLNIKEKIGTKAYVDHIFFEMDAIWNFVLVPMTVVYEIECNLVLDPSEGAPRIETSEHKINVPVNKPIRISSGSSDVLHSLYIKNSLTKIDAMPGRINSQEYTFVKVGEQYGACAELCGVYHGFMPITFLVVSYEDFLHQKGFYTQDDLWEAVYLLRDKTVEYYDRDINSEEFENFLDSWREEYCLLKEYKWRKMFPGHWEIERFKRLADDRKDEYFSLNPKYDGRALSHYKKK